MNEQNGLYGQIDVDKLWSMLQACPELIKTYQTRDGATHHAVNVNIGYRQQPSQSGDVAYIQIACKVADRKYDKGAYYIGDLKPSGQGGQSASNQPPMANNTPWGAAPMPTAAPAATPPPAAPTAPAAAPGMPFPPPQGNNNAPF